MDDLMTLEDDLGLAPESQPLPPWKVLIVDDEPEIHAVTRLVLGDFQFEGRRLQFFSAYSGQEGQAQLSAHPDIALILLDVVMETEHAGLDVARWTRDVLNNQFVRIVLRTGQPGQAPEQRVTTEYDINDYKEKTELTTQKLTATVRVALRGYRDIMAIERARQGLERVINASTHIFTHQRSAEFASAVLMQLGGLAGMERGALYLRIPPGTPRRSDQLPEHFEISAATGEFERYIEAGRNEEVLPAPLVASLHEAYLHKQHLFRDDHYVLHFVDSQHGESLLYVGDAWNLSPMDFKLVELFCTNVSIAYENLHLNQELHDAQLEMICLLAGAAETRSRETAAHVKRVGLIAEALALALGMEAREAELLRHAAPLHDVGKIGIPDAVLNKPGRHDEAEATVMRTHADLGAQMLAESRRPVLRLAAEIARSHHENWDGSGYPQGLAGAAIPLPGRIVAVADVWDALGSVRCYKPAWDGAAIRAHFTEQRGRKFDPTVVDALFAHWNTLEEIRRRFPDPA
jgi:putative nucleotidyltransferase with HDIG domain